jgi:phage baseplate assembly protein gpV
MIGASGALARALAPQSAQNRDQLVHAIVTARVEQIEDDGTYLVKFFGMNGQDDDDRSAPARVMMPMAGARRGVHFFPEPGDEVVVAFHAGDTNTPIILGAVWNSGSPPPDQARQSASNDIRTIVTRSGHELTFDDTPGREKVTVKSQGGHSIVLDDTPGSPRIEVTSNAGTRVLLDDAVPGRVMVETSTCRLTLSATGGVSIEATDSISLRAPRIELIGANVTLGAGPGTVTIDSLPYKAHMHPLAGPVPGVTGPVAV